MTTTTTKKSKNGGSKKSKKSQRGGSKKNNPKSKAKSMSKSSSEFKAYCVHERKPDCSVLDGVEVNKKTKNGRMMTFLVGKCSNCGGKISRILANKKA